MSNSSKVSALLSIKSLNYIRYVNIHSLWHELNYCTFTDIHERTCNLNLEVILLPIHERTCKLNLEVILLPK